MATTATSTIDTVNAAATAIVSAGTRTQPTTLPKKRWGSCWNLYWCFGSHKNSKRIGHAILVPEPVVPGIAAPTSENLPHLTAVILPFIAPPSSPFVHSDPSSLIHSPAGKLSLASLSIHSYSPHGPANIFTIGPYAHETQLVSPPVFSTFNTEPSTASFTPPPESGQVTTPPSPEVPFAQLLRSSLERTRRNSGSSSKFALSHYEFQSYQLNQGSPGGHLLSPGSTISYSGTSTPFPDGRSILELRMVEAPKLLGFDHFTTYKWGSRVGSGSLTPDGGGLGSQLGSGCLTPDVGQGSRLGSGSLTPNGLVPSSRDGFLLENNFFEVATLPNSRNRSKRDDIVVDRRVSFELTGEDVARCLENKSLALLRQSPEPAVAEDQMPVDIKNRSEASFGETSNEKTNKFLEETVEENFYRKHCPITLGSIKEFNFDNTKEDDSVKPGSGTEWWANEKIAGKNGKSSENWMFFPSLQPGIS